MTHIHTHKCVPALEKAAQAVRDDYSTKTINLRKQLEEAKRNPDHDYPIEPVKVQGEPTAIAFTKKFKGYRNYSYVAVRGANGNYWSVTGKADINGAPWSEVMKFVTLDERDAEAALNSIKLMKVKNKSLPRESSLREEEEKPIVMHTAGIAASVHLYG